MVITQQIFEAFLKCPTKSQLSRDASMVVENSVGWPQELEQIFIRNGWSRLCAGIPADQVITSASAAEAIRERRCGLIVDCMLQTSDLRARLHGLEIIGAPANAQTRYVPIRFLSNEKVSTTDKLLLAFDAFVFSQVSGSRPDRGKLIHGREYRTTVVSLASLYGRIKSVIKAITALQANASPPPVVLNRHCSECQYASRCRQVAEKADDLSLLAKMTEKTRQKYHQKGIFTVTQLSYTYRPRRRRGGVKHDHALKALAIRKNQVHVIGKVAFSQVGTPIYIDVEGDPDRGFYYCIGLRFETGGLMTQHSYWADTPADEEKMWADCLLALSTVECPRLIHYGSYETTFLRQMKKRYPNVEQAGLLDQLMTSAVNLLSIIYPQVYFPTCSNGLKDIASHLGFRWSEPTASGVAAIRWRRQWELSRALDQKQTLLTYNAEDCAAAQMVAEALLNLSQYPSGDNASVVDVTTLKREYPQRFGKIEFVRPDFEQINNAARWDHQREKVYVRSSKLLRRLQGVPPKTRRAVPVNKVVTCEEQRPTRCASCGGTIIYRFGRLSRFVRDLKLSGSGIKRWVVQYFFPRYICWQCKATFHQFAHQARYGNTICAYVAYQIVELQLAQNAVAKSMQQLFDIPASRGMINRLKASMAERHEDTYQAILKNIVGGTLVHADETRANVAGKEAYVWVFTNLEDVAFVYSESREGGTAQKILQEFRGVLVSDFYAAYDAFPGEQQKCLIHLMRDINEDLYKQPFNEEMKEIARDFGELLRMIVDSVDRFGLKAHHLRKHRPAVDRFFETLAKRDYQTEVAIGYGRRFQKNQDKLFTFLDHDGIPWNNNNAEHAIKAFARLRNIIGGSSTAKGLREYLVLLSLSETCKCKGFSFLDFLLSQEANVDSFAGRTRRRRGAPADADA